jgi:protease-4
MRRARAKGKPLIASFSDVAASGGYYAATGADAIVSGANTLTGSIGVFALRPALGNTPAKIGVTTVELERGENADLLLSAEPLSPGAQAILDRSVRHTYELFLERVSEARDMSTDDVDAVAQGRVWTGRQAYERGLVDELGGLHAAVQLAKRELGLDADTDAVLVPFPPPLTFTEQLVELMEMRAQAWAWSRLPFSESVRRVEALVSQLPPGQPLLVPPVLVEIR